MYKIECIIFNIYFDAEHAEWYDSLQDDDMAIGTWNMQNNLKQFTLYNLLNIDIKSIFKAQLIKFSVSQHILNIETGRFNKI